LAIATSISAFAQQPSQPRRIGFLKFLPVTDEIELGPFRQGMRELGHVEGKSYVLEIRSADNKPGRMSALAEELVTLKPDVIWVTTTPGIEAVKKATTSIPVVFGASFDPVLSGYVRTLARPGGNLTGLSLMTLEIAGKQLELLRAALPKLARVAVLVSPGKTHAGFVSALEDAAKPLKVAVSRYEAASLAELETVIPAMRRNSVEGVIVGTGPVFQSNRKMIIDLGLKATMPTLFPYIEAMRDGALLCYGPSLTDTFRRSASYVDKILKGAKPADLPVEQPTKFEMGVNVKTAKALGITIPQALLLRADEVIE
jgi:putative ABC transport system substrate-binding protein